MASNPVHIKSARVLVQLKKPPSISLPKRGEAIRSSREKFAANPVTGTGSMFDLIANSLASFGFDPQQCRN